MRFLALAALLCSLIAAPASALEQILPDIRRSFAEWQQARHVPGLVWGIVRDGELLHVEAAGVQDLQQRRPVTADSAFRIASMSKAFTAYAILQLAEQGKLRLDDPAAQHVPEMQGWAQGIRIADLLHHTAGFVTDDPYGDRQQPLPEADFTAMLRAGAPFQRAPGTAYEYSNFGYAVLGRIVSNVSGKPYQQHIAETIWQPLGMTATRFEVADVPDTQLARGYRFEQGRHRPEPMMADGAYGAMGGVITTAHDYGRWIAHLLSGWPAAAQADGDRARATIRAMRHGGGFVHQRPRPGQDAPDCRMMMIYAGGLVSGEDCLLGAVLFHSGGYPGYGSHMLLLPDAGVGLFAFANHTYAAPLPPVWDAAGTLHRAGLANARDVPLSTALATGYAAAQRIWKAGRIDIAPDKLAMNMLLDRPANLWASELAQLKQQAGQCDSNTAIQPNGALSGRFRWPCTHGTLNGQLLLAPRHEAEIQALRLQFTPR